MTRPPPPSGTKSGPRVVPDFVPDGGGGLVNRGGRFQADLGVTKTINNNTPSAGASVVYTIDVTNYGPQSTAKVTVADVLPTCLGFVSATTTQGTYDETTGLWSVGALKLKETLTLTIEATVGEDCAGTVTNTVEVTGSSLPEPDDFFNLFDDPPMENNVATASFEVPTSRVLDGETFALGSNYPNPFNPVTVVPFSLANTSKVSIKVYDLVGREVAVLVDGVMPTGRHEVTFEASMLPTGVYLIRMEAMGKVFTQRVTLMK